MISNIHKAKNIQVRRNISFSYSLDSIFDGDIADAVDRGKQSAIKDIEILGMADVLSLMVERIVNLPVEDRNITDEDDEESESEALAGDINMKHYKKHAVLLITQTFLQV